MSYYQKDTLKDEIQDDFEDDEVIEKDEMILMLCTKCKHEFKMPKWLLEELVDYETNA